MNDDVIYDVDLPAGSVLAGSTLLRDLQAVQSAHYREYAELRPIVLLLLCSMQYRLTVLSGNL